MASWEDEHEQLSAAFLNQSFYGTQAKFLEEHGRRGTQCLVKYVGDNHFFTAFRTWDEFEASYMAVNLERKWYELIWEERPCVLYFDIEADSWDEINVDFEDGEDKVKKMVGRVKAFLREKLMWFQPENQPPILYVSTACNAQKFSMHVVVRWAFNKNTDCQILAQWLESCITTEEEWKDLRLKKGQFPTVIDTGVYTKNRVMRLLYSHKHNKRDRPLVKYDQALGCWSDYLITRVMDTDLLWDDLFKPTEFLLFQERRPKKKQKTVRIVNRTGQLEARTSFEDAEFEACVEALRSRFPNVSLYRNAQETFANGGSFGWFPRTSDTGKCPCNKTHSSNNASAYYRSDLKHLQVRCFNNACKDTVVTLPVLYESEEDLLLEEEQIQESDENTIFLNVPYLTEEDGKTPRMEVKEALRDYDVVCIKSATGTGKTTILQSIVDRTLARKPTAVITALSVRRSFANNVAPRIGLTSYLGLGHRDLIQTEDKLMIQLDSLLKADKAKETRERDLLILDEFTALCAHFLAGTLRSKHRAVWDKFRCLLARSKKVVILCADLDKKGLNLLDDVLPNRDRMQIVNRYTHTDTKVVFYRDKTLFEQLLQDKLNEGANVALASTSKRYVRTQKAFFSQMIGDHMIKDLTADATDQEKTDICEDPTILQNYQLFMYTPTLTVGVDINFDHFDHQFAYIRPGTLCARDFMQQMARVRTLKSKTIYVYVEDAAPSNIRAWRKKSLLDKDRIRDALEGRLDFQYSMAMKRVIAKKKACIEKMGGEWDYDTGQLQVCPIFTKMAVHFTQEDLCSVADFEGEMISRCREKGYEVRLNYTEADFQATVEHEEEYSGCSKEYYRQVSEQRINWAFDEDNDEVETRDQKMMLEKRMVLQRLKMDEDEITPELIEDFGPEKTQEIENFIGLAELSASDDGSGSGDTAGEFSSASILEHCLKRHRQPEHFDSYAIMDPVLHRLYKCQILYLLMLNVLGWTSGILGTDWVSEKDVTDNLKNFEEDELKDVCATLWTEFKLPTPPRPTARSLLFALSKCLRKFCGVELKSVQRVYRANGKRVCVKAKAIDKEMRWKYLSLLARGGMDHNFDSGTFLDKIYGSSYFDSMETEEIVQQKRRRIN